MKMLLPDRAAAQRQGWTHQVQWIEGGNTCLHRCKSGAEVDAWADKLVKQGLEPWVIDLKDALQVH